MDKHITKNLNLDKIVRFNPVRSYREGNLMTLNYSIIDNQEEFIYSISFEANRNDDDNTIDKIVSDYKYDSNEIAFKLCIHCNSHDWFSLLDFMGLEKKINRPSFIQEFVNYIGEDMIFQIINDVKDIDFFSLQTKEEYLAHEKRINDFVSFIRAVINQKVKQKKFDESEILVRAIAEEELPLTKYWEERLKEELEDQRYLDWLNECQQEMIMNIVDDDIEAYQEAADYLR